MTFHNSTLGEILKSAFGPEVWEKMWPAIGETLYMLGMALVIMLAFGLILGMALYVTDPNGLKPMNKFNTVLSAIVNALRSLPSMIMIIITIPLGRLITGQGYGSGACIIALAISCIPMFGRLVSNNFLEVASGKIEAARAMGAENLTILLQVVFPESLPALIRSFVVAVISVLSMTALAGAFGAGGIGYLAVQFGFNRFRYDILIATVVVLIVMAELIQLIGDFFARLVLKKRHMN